MNASSHQIAVFLYEKFELLDVCGPLDVFATANRVSREPTPLYEFTLIAEEAGPVKSLAGVSLMADVARRDFAGDADTLFIPGGDCLDDLLTDDVTAWVARCSENIERTISVCTGALVLAAAGLLDGRRATTHWEACARLAADHPAVEVQEDAIFIHDGKVWTSAGITAGIDLALGIVEADHGRTLALAVARELVVFLKRPGGQSQFSVQLSAQVASGPELAELVDWLPDHLDADLGVERLAERVSMSPRQFARRFREELGETPARFVERLRVETARALFDDGVDSLPDVARACGFGTVERLRRAYHRRLGVLPSHYIRWHTAGA